MIGRLLGRLNRVFDKTPDDFLAMRVTAPYALAWSVQDDVLTLTPSDGTSPSVIDLGSVTLAGLAALLSAQAGLKVDGADPDQLGLSAAVLISGSGAVGAGTPFELRGFRSLLWAVLSSYAVELRTAAAQVALLPSQMDVRTALGYWLGFLGTRFGVPRIRAEPDSSYSPRIIAEVVRPKVNNVAMEMALEAYTGQPATVTDVTLYKGAPYTHNGQVLRNGSITRNTPDLSPEYGLFDVAYSYDFLSGTDPSTFQSIVTGLVERLRAAGTHMRALVLNGSGLSDPAPLPTDQILVAGQFALADTVTLASDALSPISAFIGLSEVVTAPTEAATINLTYAVLHSGARRRDGSFLRSYGYVVQETVEGVPVSVTPIPSTGAALDFGDPASTGFVHFMALG